MSEFFFKNLSVKLFPEVAAGQDAPGCLCCSYEFECGPCTQCTDTPTEPPCSPCTQRPTEPECGPCTNGETDPPDCGPCTGGCTGGITNECLACTDFTNPCVFEPVTRPPDCEGDTACTNATRCIDTIPIVLPEDPAGSPGGTRPPDVIRQELAVLRAELRQAMGLPPEEQEEVPVAGRARTVDEVEHLRGALLEAVAELDEQRAQIERDRPPE